MSRLFELIYSDTFEKDMGKLDAQLKLRLDKCLKKLLDYPARYKPLEGYSNVFRLRFSKFRLVYKVEGNKIILLFVRKRDIAYKMV